jgi:hypothetical protein
MLTTNEDARLKTVAIPSISFALAIVTLRRRFSAAVLATEENLICMVDEVAGIDTVEVIYVDEVGVAVTPAEVHEPPPSKL